MKTYKTINFEPAPNMPKWFPSEIQALAAAETAAPGMKATAEEMLTAELKEAVQ